MHSDIKKSLKSTKYEQIITKHEWMIAALELLEKDSTLKRDETPLLMYEAIFIDPSKLTPFQ